MSKETTENRKAYVKPEIRRVQLKPEESLVAGCKIVGGSTPVTTCELNVCFNVGS